MSSAKHGLIGFTKATALETAHQNITCNAICPGWVLPSLVQAQIDASAARDHISADAAKKPMLMENQPSGDLVTAATSCPWPISAWLPDRP